MRQIVTSLDIGSDKIKIIVSEINNNELFVLACLEFPSKGIKKGFVVDPDEALNSLKNCFKKINEVIGTKIDNVILVVPSYDTSFIISEGYTTINREDMKVNTDDIVRAMQACVYNKIESNKELINIMPMEYIINEKEVVSDPKGKEANKLTIKALLALCPKKNVYGIISVLESIGVRVCDICLGGLADYHAFRNKKSDSETIGIINIGKDKTEVSILSNGLLINTLTIDLGGRNINRDISYIYDIYLKDSQRIKEHFALAHTKNASTSETNEMLNKSKDKVLINQYEVSEIVYKRLKDILELSKKQINILTNKEISYIIITGGTTEIEDFVEVSQEVITSSIIGKIDKIGIRNSKFSSAYGITKYYVDKLNFRNKLASTMSLEKQKELFQDKRKFNSNLLNKVYDYFFEN